MNEKQTMITLIDRENPELRNQKKEWADGVVGIVLIVAFVLLMLATI